MEETPSERIWMAGARAFVGAVLGAFFMLLLSMAGIPLFGLGGVIGLALIVSLAALCVIWGDPLVRWLRDKAESWSQWIWW